jgi:uncharacterized protein (TIGR04222 family)
MDELWGVSGSQFLLLYADGLLVALTVALVMRWRARRSLEAEGGAPLGLAELALLAGGPYRAAGAVIAWMVERRAVLLTGTGRLMAAATVGAAPVETAVLRAIDRAPSEVAAVASEVAEGPAVLTMQDELVRRGLLLAPAAARAVQRRAVLGLYALIVVGLVRHSAAARHGDATGALTLVLMFTVGLAIVLRRRGIPARTVAGDQVLMAALGGALRGSDRWLHQCATGAGAGIAFGGFANFPDPAIRNRLVHSAIMIAMINAVGRAG